MYYPDVAEAQLVFAPQLGVEQDGPTISPSRGRRKWRRGMFPPTPAEPKDEFRFSRLTDEGDMGYHDNPVDAIEGSSDGEVVLKRKKRRGRNDNEYDSGPASSCAKRTRTGATNAFRFLYYGEQPEDEHPAAEGDEQARGSGAGVEAEDEDEDKALQRALLAAAQESGNGAAQNAMQDAQEDDDNVLDKSAAERLLSELDEDSLSSLTSGSEEDRGGVIVRKVSKTKQFTFSRLLEWEEKRERRGLDWSPSSGEDLYGEQGDHTRRSRSAYGQTPATRGSGRKRRHGFHHRNHLHRARSYSRAPQEERSEHATASAWRKYSRDKRRRRVVEDLYRRAEGSEIEEASSPGSPGSFVFFQDFGKGGGFGGG
eukprot:GSA25T00001697001.1